MNASKQVYRGVEITTDVVTYKGIRLYVVAGSQCKFASLKSAREYIRTNKWAEVVGGIHDAAWPSDDNLMGME